MTTTSYAQPYYHLGPIFVNQAQLFAFIIVIVCTIILNQFLTQTDLGKVMRGDKKKAAGLFAAPIRWQKEVVE